MLANGVISLCDGWRIDIWDVTGIWAHSMTGRSVSRRYGNAGIDTNITTMISSAITRVIVADLNIPISTAFVIMQDIDNGLYLYTAYRLLLGVGSQDGGCIGERTF